MAAALVTGPSVVPRGDGESVKIMKLVTSLPFGPRYGALHTDVRALAAAHVTAAASDRAEGRYVVVTPESQDGGNFDILRMGRAGRGGGSTRPWALPKWLVGVVGPLLGVSSRAARVSIAGALALQPWRASTAKADRDLCWADTAGNVSIDDSCADMARWMRETGLM